MSKVDRKRAEAAMAEFLAALGHSGPVFDDTPARVTAAYVDELLSGYSVDVEQLIAQGSEPVTGACDPIILDNIAVSTVCPHHLLVAQGKALVAYVPGTRVLGLGVVSRLVNAFSRRLVLQEQIAGQVADALMSQGGAQGAFCRLQMNHACLQARGAAQSEAEVITWAGRGSLQDPALLEVVLGRFVTTQGEVEEPSDAAALWDDEVSSVHDLPDEGRSD